MSSRRHPSPSAILRLPLIGALAVALLAAAGLAVRAPAPAVAAGPVAGPVTAQVSLPTPVTPLAARRGGGFGSRRLSPDRPASRSRPVARRNPNTGRALRSFSRTLLQALGIGFLLSLLFGIGPGGSPLGLLLLLGIIALIVVSRRRRRAYGDR